MSSSNFWCQDSIDKNLVQVDHSYRLLVEAVQDYAIFMLDRSGNVVSWNSGAQRTKGYSPDEIVGRHFSVFHTPEDALAGKPARLLATAASAGRAEDEGWRIRKDGSRFWAYVVISAVRNEEGELVGFAKVTRDLSESRRLDQLERAAADSALIQHAQESERKRIARELHDELGQRISALKMTLELFESEISPHLPTDVTQPRNALQEAAQQLDGMATAMRRIAADLRPPLLDDLGLEAAVEWITEDFERHHGVQTKCELEEGLNLNDGAAISLYRVTQEALNNVARHSGAMQVTVALFRDKRDCFLRIRDDGVGFPSGWKLRPDALGMRGMRERVAQLGGTLHVEARPGDGVTVTARLPISRVTRTDG